MNDQQKAIPLTTSPKFQVGSKVQIGNSRYSNVESGKAEVVEL